MTILRSDSLTVPAIGLREAPQELRVKMTPGMRLQDRPDLLRWDLQEVDIAVKEFHNKWRRPDRLHSG